jgi:hypothetical protein
MSWHEVVDTNLAYCRAGLDYWPFSKLTRCVRSIFGQCTYADRYHLGQKAGIVARTSRALPFAGSVAWLLGRLRTSVMVATKTSSPHPPTSYPG